MKRLFEAHPLFFVFLGMLLCLAPVLALRDFTPANELRYLSIADEALAQGHWFTFSNHGEPYADKPPLYFWILMGCRVLFGVHSRFVLSLLSLLTAFCIAWVMDRWAFRELPPLTRAAAATLFLSTFFVTGMSVYVRMDLLMTLFIMLAIYAYWEGKSSLFGLFTFLALFTKGPVGLLLPPLTVLVYLVATGHWRGLGKAFSWQFWVFLAIPSLIWLGCVYYEGGPEYLWNLTVNQTAGRALHSSHHQEPFWYYLPVLFGVAAPWCLLTVPSLVMSFAKGGKTPVRRHHSARSRRERLFLTQVLTGGVLLSLSRSKLAIYLLPLLPFLGGVFVLVEQRRGWEKWMRVALGVVAGIFALIGVAAIAGYPAFDRLPVPAEYAFARSPLLIVAGLLLLGGAVYAFRCLKGGWQRTVLSLGLALMLTILCLSPLTPKVNELTGYRQLSEDVRSRGGFGDIYTIGLKRPENMDVYLHRPVHAVDGEAFAADPSRIPAGATVIVSEKADAAVSGRYSGILEASGRTRSLSSAGLYGVWR